MKAKAIPIFLLLVALLCAPPRHAAAVELEYPVFVGGFSSPVLAVGSGDGSGRLFVVEQPGRIRVVASDGQVQAQSYLDISPRVIAGGERGLLGLAFHPNFAANGFFYVNYTRQTDGATIVSRFTASPPSAAQADSASEVVILGPVAQPQSNHNGGVIEFGPDGYLYIGLGDGGGGGDQGPGHTTGLGNAQDLTNLLGKILRIDVDHPAQPLNYSIPADNPFVTGPQGSRPEIFAWGLRNPWRFSFDPSNGRLFCADVGQNLIEEIDLIVSGGNYGWRRMEGSACFNPSLNCQTGSLLLPIYEYSHNFGCSVTGGYVYRGTQFPGLAGLYLFGDYCNGAMWTLRESPTGWVATPRAFFPGNISSFGRDDAGELYICSHISGTVHRVIDTAPSPAAILAHLLGGGAADPAFDRNADGVIDIADLVALSTE